MLEAAETYGTMACHSPYIKFYAHDIVDMVILKIYDHESYLYDN